MTFGEGFVFLWLLWFIASIAILALIVWVLVKVAKLAWNGGSPPPPPPPTVDPALQILRERYARGEITADEFEDRRRKLGL